MLKAVILLLCVLAVYVSANLPSCTRKSCEEDSDCGNKSKCSKVVDDDKLRKCKDSEDTSDCFCSCKVDKSSGSQCPDDYVCEDLELGDKSKSKPGECCFEGGS